MRNNCRYCAKSRLGLLYFFVGFIVLNSAARKYFGLASVTVDELLFIPSVATIFLGACVIAKRYLLPNLSLRLSRKHDD